MANTINCAFACHPPSSTVGFTDTTGAARAAGATLRIDVVSAAIASIIDDLEVQGFSGQQLSIAVHTFSNSLKAPQSATTDMARIRAALAGVSLDSTAGEGGTMFYNALDRVRRIVGTSGDASSANRRKKFVILFTDGVASNVSHTVDPAFSEAPGFRFFNPVYNGNGAFAMQGFDPSACEPIKRNDVTITTLNVRYVVPHVSTDDDGRFNEIERFLAPNIAQNMERCATSPEFALWADTPADIRKALEEIAVLLATATVRISS
jgi:hypothetical protein